MTATLSADPREKLGSRTARKLRASGRIPISIQGEGKDPLNASIDEHEFLTARRHHEHLFEVQLDGGMETVVVRELQFDAHGDRIIHVEFRRVVRGQDIESEVELSFTGHPKGFLNHLVTHVTVLSRPSMIPDGIEVDVDGLEPGHVLVAGDLTLPEGASLACEADLNVAVVTAPRGTELEKPAEEEIPAEGAAPEAEEPASED